VCTLPETWLNEYTVITGGFPQVAVAVGGVKVTVPLQATVPLGEQVIVGGVLSTIYTIVCEVSAL
jgi:hypothetical protein